VTFTAGELDAVGTGTIEVYDGGTTNVTAVALAGGMILLSEKTMSARTKADGDNISYSKWA
jgi:hypothetical protein